MYLQNFLMTNPQAMNGHTVKKRDSIQVMSEPPEMSIPFSPEDARAALRWYLEAGVDEALEDVPQDRFSVLTSDPIVSTPETTVSTPTPSETGKKSTPAKKPAPLPPEGAEAISSAVHLARAAKTLDDLRASLETFDGCPLKRTATNLVFGEGAADARVLIVGEAPGAEEDRQGKPFVGDSGQLLDKMLTSIGVARTEVFISNTIFWRPPGNRTPTAAETAVCQPFVERLVELIDPQIVVLLGKAAAASMLGKTEAIGRLRGKWMDYSTAGLPRPIPALAMYHPSYLLGTPSAKRHAWRDLLLIKDKLNDGQPASG